ncbi:MAG: 2-oxo acid dehydrogenase subunit E2 [Spirochaetaceae bacterium]|nr:MAG: 2-oxo acid dehydrogenase subunit E2 [Spirochaetaceae bacterium]
MATEVLMPRQGQSVESCIIVAWKKQVGDAVQEGDVLCEVETDKATFEVESPASGTLISVLYEDGDEVPVLEQIAFVGQAGEEPPASGAPGSGQAAAEAGSGSTGSAAATTDSADAPAAGAEPGTAGAAEAASDTRSAATDAGTSAAADAPRSGAGDRSDSVFISPRARDRAERAGVPWQTLAGTGPGGRVIERDIEAAMAAGTVATRDAAGRIGAGGQAQGAGSGAGGRVTSADLREGATAAGATQDAGTATVADGAGIAGAIPGMQRDRSTTETKLAGIRKKIATRMLESVQNSAQLTLHASGDARALLAYRARLKAAGAPYDGISLNDMVLFAVSRLLPRHPALNATFDGTAIHAHGAVHLGMAVDTERGLMVPVIRDADLRPLASISTEARRLAGACRGGNITADEMAGGTFTITNLGAMGIEMFTPVLNPPQVAILGVCSIEAKPVLKTDGSVEHIPSMGFSLTIDHQVVDGAPAGRFLKDLSESIAQFDLLLADTGLIGGDS